MLKTWAVTGLTHHQAVRRLQQLCDDLTAAFAGVVVVEQGEEDWSILPSRIGAVGVSWFFDGKFGAVLQVLTEAELGGRWELTVDDAESVDWIVDIVWSVALGRAEELYGPGRSCLRITLSDGSVEEETGGAGLAALVLCPGWRDQAERQQYLPWSSSGDLTLP